MASKDKPKPASKITRNPNRRNGKAWKKNPIAADQQTDNGGFMGYSRNRLLKMAGAKSITVEALMEEMREKRAKRRDRGNKVFRSSATRPGIGDCTYKMDSVHRHQIKPRPYPCVPKGSKHAGKPDNKTDHRQDAPVTKAQEMALAAA